ncbi:MAG: transposase, family [Clostridiales bacterium]|jgi:IS30 family transposase|nr:transposase, family [Clostridiales bacterium]
MSQDYYNINERKGKHLTERERYTIETLLQDGKAPSEIALKLGRHKRTIEREVKRCTVKLLNSDLTYRDQYCADAGQRIRDEKGKNKGPDLKIGNDHKLAQHIEDRIIKDEYSPDAVIG